MRVYTDPYYVPDSDPPTIIVHALKENRRPIGFAPWPKKPKRKKKKEKK